MVVASVAAAALLPLERRHRRALGRRQQRAEIERGVPAWVVRPPAVHSRLSRTVLEDFELLERGLHVGLVATDADEALHALLQLGLDRVRVLAVGARQRGQR